MPGTAPRLSGTVYAFTPASPLRLRYRSDARWSNQSNEHNRRFSADSRAEIERSEPKADLQSPQQDARSIGGGERRAQTGAAPMTKLAGMVSRLNDSQISETESNQYGACHEAKIVPDTRGTAPGMTVERLACTRFRRHPVRCFDGTGGGSWKGESLPASSSLRLCG